MSQTNENNNSEREPKGFPALIVIGAVILLGLLSLVPWSGFTGGFIKDFNLLSDIMPMVEVQDTVSSEADTEDLDPELVRQMAEAQNDPDEQSEAQAVSVERPVCADSVVTVPPVRPSRVGDTVEIEDYTVDGQGMRALREAIRGGVMARIAFLGDSYIEGDILCQDFRSMMQARYGGSGVGYMNLHSDFPGFRRSVRQSGSGWKEYKVGAGAKNRYISLTENYFSPSGNARAIYKGTNKIQCADRWSHSRLLFVAPSGGEVKMRLSDTARWEIMTVDPSPDVVEFDLLGETSYCEVVSSTPSLVALGVWLDAASGVSVDCMSSRGFSGLTLSKVDSTLCSQESRFIDYSLIILEFGINAMSSRQTNYSVYEKGMINVIRHIRGCYPNADILMMGIGDRGEKSGGSVHSMSSARNMIAAQRDAARKARCMFWDTREAMGGDNAIVDFTSRGLANKDYVHLNHKGGKVVAEELFKAFVNQIDR